MSNEIDMFKDDVLEDVPNEVSNDASNEELDDEPNDVSNMVKSPEYLLKNNLISQKTYDYMKVLQHYIKVFDEKCDDCSRLMKMIDKTKQECDKTLKEFTDKNHNFDKKSFDETNEG